jgi:hypothetical protein
METQLNNTKMLQTHLLDSSKDGNSGWIVWHIKRSVILPLFDVVT